VVKVGHPKGVDKNLIFILLGQTRGKIVWDYLRNKRGFVLFLNTKEPRLLPMLVSIFHPM
jgi:hypothetical protein